MTIPPVGRYAISLDLTYLYMATMETQQRSVIVTAIVLAIILGGALVWLLNRTPADQLATQAPPEETQTPTGEEPGTELIAQDDNREQVVATPTSAPDQTTAISPTGTVQGVAATAPTGTTAMAFGALSAVSGLGGLGLVSLAFFRRISR